MSDTAKITVMKNGPAIVHCEAGIEQSGDYALPEGKDTLAICRCGKSDNMPLCSGAHVQNPFEEVDDEA